MELFNEALPFLIGLVLPLLIIVLQYLLRLERFKIPLTFVAALIVGSCVSLFMGELARGVGDGAMAVIIDTSLVYTGSQLTYYLIWKPLLETRLSRQGTQLAKSSQS
jgi:uncharacterized membrane protein